MSHTVVWFDLPVEQLNRAIAFYQAVLAMDVKEEFPGVAVFAHGDTDVAGCLFESDEHKPSTQGPLIYLNVNGRLAEAVANVRQFGGSIEQPPHEIGPFGQRAIVIDSEGNRIALHSE